MTTFNFLAFNPGDERHLLRKLGATRSRDGTYSAAGSPLRCECCKVAIQEENFGAALNGSRLFYCSEPSCIVGYVQDRMDGMDELPKIQKGLLLSQG